MTAIVLWLGVMGMIWYGVACQPLSSLIESESKDTQDIKDTQNSLYLPLQTIIQFPWLKTPRAVMYIEPMLIRPLDG